MCVQLSCCGAVGPQDYYNSIWYNNTQHSEGGFVPLSCCRALDEPEPHYCQIEAVAYSDPLNADTQRTAKVDTDTHTHTYTLPRPFVRDYPGEPVPER